MDQGSEMVKKSKYFIKMDYRDATLLKEVAVRNGIDVSDMLCIPDSNGQILYSFYLDDHEASMMRLALPAYTFFNYTQKWPKPIAATIALQ
jgi:hypothetical protein